MPAARRRVGLMPVRRVEWCSWMSPRAVWGFKRNLLERLIIVYFSPTAAFTQGCCHAEKSIQPTETWKFAQSSCWQMCSCLLSVKERSPTQGWIFTDKLLVWMQKPTSGERLTDNSDSDRGRISPARPTELLCNPGSLLAHWGHSHTKGRSHHVRTQAELEKRNEDKGR